MNAKIGDYVRTKIYPCAGQIIDISKDGIICVQFPAISLCHLDDLQPNPDREVEYLNEIADWRTE